MNRYVFKKAFLQWVVFIWLQNKLRWSRVVHFVRFAGYIRYKVSYDGWGVVHY